MSDLFNGEVMRSSAELSNQHCLSQYFTPSWCSSLLIQQFYPHLDSSDYVIEPSCGEGSFLNALPEHVDAMGIELDPVVAERARCNTGRFIHTGSALDYAFTRPVNHFIGNPPFKLSFLNTFLAKVQNVLVEGGTVGFILSAHLLQTSNTVSRWSCDYSIASNMLPRDIYAGLSKPLTFVIFTKDKLRRFVGMAMYAETRAINQLPNVIKELLCESGKGGVWPRVVEKALLANGGEASLNQIYEFVEHRRPTKTHFWREQIRKVLRQGFFLPLGDGRYRHPTIAA